MSNATNDDGVCDDIKDPMSLQKVDLHPVDQGGDAWFGAATDEPSNAPTMPAWCDYLELLSGRPPRRCANRSDLTKAISHVRDGKPPVIYALGNMHTGDGVACAGVDYEIQNHLLDLAGVGPHVAQTAREGGDQLDVLAQHPTQHGVEPADHHVEVEHLGREHLAAAVGEQLAGEVGGAERGLFGLLRRYILRTADPLRV